MQKGFTFPELIVVMGLAAMLFGFVIINTAKVQRQASLDTTVSQFISDMKSQQIKTMTGINEAAPVGISQGIHIDANRYILFRGSTYDPNSASNLIINLDSNMQLSPSQNIVYSEGSGEISGFDSGFNPTIVLTNTIIGDKLTITLNRYGVVTGVQ